MDQTYRTRIGKSPFTPLEFSMAESRLIFRFWHLRTPAPIE
jgi:hypothetical protein